MSHIVYLYGFVPAATDTGDLPAGIDDCPVEQVSAGSVIALVSRLSPAVYAAAALEPRLEDLDWVAARGLAHERVVAWGVDHGDILPAPLFTLFSSLDALRADVERRADAIAAGFVRLQGLREWDVKLACRADVLAANAAAVSDAVRELDVEIAEAAPGRRFLLERKRNELLKTEVADAAQRVASQFLERMRTRVRDARRLELAGTAAEVPVVLSAALLVAREEESDVVELLRAEADALRALGFELSFSGPWAAYRFLADTEGRA